MTNTQAVYRDGNDLITDTHATLQGQTFDMNDIQSVSVVAPVMRRVYGYAAIGIGLLLLIVGYLVWGTFLTPMLVGAVLIVVGICIALIVREAYTVRVNAHNGHVTAIPFAKRTQSDQVVAALSKVLAGKR